LHRAFAEEDRSYKLVAYLPLHHVGMVIFWSSTKIFLVTQKSRSYFGMSFAIAYDYPGVLNVTKKQRKTIHETN